MRYHYQILRKPNQETNPPQMALPTFLQFPLIQRQDDTTVPEETIILLTVTVFD